MRILNLQSASAEDIPPIFTPYGLLQSKLGENCGYGCHTSRSHGWFKHGVRLKYFPPNYFHDPLYINAASFLYRAATLGPYAPFTACEDLFTPQLAGTFQEATFP